MLKLLKALRQDEYGVILSTEIVIVGTVLVIGLITGMTCLQKSVNGELQDVANAIGSLDQSYSFSGHRKSGVMGRCCAWTSGSSWQNCETNAAGQQVDVVGACCQQAVAAPCGTQPCNGCSSCGQTPCGSCGGTSGCSECGHAAAGSRAIETGVPKMKVTEFPIQSSDCTDCTDSQPAPAAHGQSLPEGHPPIPVPDSLPDGHPPVAIPLPEGHPPVTHHHVIGVPLAPAPPAHEKFIFPSHVW